jgi:predicted short-subunit dehydrogenase-like oxidoreductase (DUF2520 family)
MQKTLAIIGAGRVGRALGRRFRELGWKIGAVSARNPACARRAVRFIGAGTPHEGVAPEVLASRVILIATPDDSIAEVARELARAGQRMLSEKIILHTSGALDSAVLKPLAEAGAAVGSMHPMQSFSGVGVPPLDGRVFAIEGHRMAARVASQMARALGGSAMRVPSGEKALYHAAASLAAGHVLAIEEAATRLLMQLGLRRREALRALLPLTRQVLDNFERLGPRSAWTGPLSRGDLKVVAAHVAALAAAPDEFSSAYAALNRLAARVLEPNPSRMLAGLEKISSGRKAKAAATGSTA